MVAHDERDLAARAPASGGGAADRRGSGRSSRRRSPSDAGRDRDGGRQVISKRSATSRIAPSRVATSIVACPLRTARSKRMRWKNLPAIGVGVLIGIQDVQTEGVEQLGERRHEARPVAAAREQGSGRGRLVLGIGHREFSGEETSRDPGVWGRGRPHRGSMGVELRYGPRGERPINWAPGESLIPEFRAVHSWGMECGSGPEGRVRRPPEPGNLTSAFGVLV